MRLPSTYTNEPGLDATGNSINYLAHVHGHKTALVAINIILVVSMWLQSLRA